MRRTLAGALCGAVLAVATAWKVGSAAWEDPFAPFVEPGFPFIVSTVDAGKLGAAFPERNLAVRCVVLMLGNETYACFDTDLLRMSAAWHGGFVTMTTMAQVSYQQPFNKNNLIPRVLGKPIVATGIYPGWMGAMPAFNDPRPASANPGDIGRGPIAPSAGRWNGLHVVKDAAVLSYAVDGTTIDEQVSSIAEGAQVGIARTFRTGAIARPLTLVVGEVGNGVASTVDGNVATVLQGVARDTATVAGVVGAPAGARLQVDSNRFVTLRIPAGAASTTFRVVVWRGAANDRAVVTAMLAKPVEMASYASGGPTHWAQTVETKGVVSPDTADYVTDRVTLPLQNPWRRNVRVSDVDFFSDGRAVAVTFDGDAWIVSGIDKSLAQLNWKRFASGLYEPLNVAVVRDTVYVLDRQGIVRLVDTNGDGEADRYENFSNVLVASGESREYPLGLGKKPGGGFYVSIGGALDNGPKTSPQIAPGFRAGSPHSGSVLEISADGRSIRPFATGLREPNIGVDPRTGRIASSDQQGNFVPATPVYLLRQGGYYNVTPTAHGADTTAALPPVAWIPHEVDASGAGEVWVTDRRMGFDGDALVHLSYAKPGPFRVFVDSTRSALQGSVIALPGFYTTPTLKGRVSPADGQLYLAGFQIWQSLAKDVSSVSRLRYTGRPSTLPAEVHAGQQGILVRFATPLAASARDAARYKLESWNYVRSSAYGSGHFKRDGSAGHDRLNVAAHLSPDGRSVLLVVPDMKPAMQMQLDYDLRGRDGAARKNTLYLTAHAVDPMNLAAAGFGSLDWRASARRAGAVAASAAPAPSSAALGAQLYAKNGCIACHSVDGTQAGKTGPTFKGLYGSRVTLANNKPAVVADDEYLRRSILEPAADIVRGYEPGMPSFKGVLSEAEVRSIVLYIRSLK